MSQEIICENGSVGRVEEILHGLQCEKFLLVCDSSFQFLSIKGIIENIQIPYAVFDGFTPNPLYEDVCRGVELFNSEECEAIVAVGGGSALDVAKCIKLFCRMDSNKNYLTQEFSDTNIPLIAVPTTAGTGSESTRHAVIYYEGAKQSISHASIVPDYAVLEPSVLKTLPIYQKKCTMLDALCQGIESWWSVNSTDESKEYSKTAVELITRYRDEYLNDGTDGAAEKIMLAANYSGRAINITQTTAPHAMSYKLTSLYGLPHGHAVALCLPEVWEYMLDHTYLCSDKRGMEYLNKVFEDIAVVLGYRASTEAVCNFRNMLAELGMTHPQTEDRESDISVLTNSVNPIRLGNNPVTLSADVLKDMYERIVK